MDMDIVVLSETWLTSNVLSSELFPENFNVFHTDRNTGRGGGVLIDKKIISVQENFMLSVSHLLNF